MLRQGSWVIKLVMSQSYDGETVFLATMALNSIIVQDIKKDLGSKCLNPAAEVSFN